jgi:hypothetical protein
LKVTDNLVVGKTATFTGGITGVDYATLINKPTISTDYNALTNKPPLTITPTEITITSPQITSAGNATVTGTQSVAGTQTITGVARANGGLIAAAPTTIAQSPWTAPTFQNNYSNTAGSSDAKAGYMKDSMGFVHLQGLITCTSASSVAAFTLPAGFRSTAARLFVGGSNATAVIPGQYWNIRIAQLTGNVELTTTANGFVDIGVVTFLADA